MYVPTDVRLIPYPEHHVYFYTERLGGSHFLNDDVDDLHDSRLSEADSQKFLTESTSVDEVGSGSWIGASGVGH